ncbi:MAG TPA: hypothetical protein VMD05_04945 [Candidatus Nanoarchaeia archaeon]|nr:hypothetical protein [Candidatus Nanoarchaeia archaeon]
MRIHEPILHWNNFTVPELREIIEHCMALERLGIAQDQEMMRSILRDIDLREDRQQKSFKQVIVQAHNKTQPKSNRQQPQEYLLQTA